MAAYRVDLLCDDHLSVFEWLENNYEPTQLIRKIAYHTVKGWYFKVVFKRQEDAEIFHRQFYPEASDHMVEAFGANRKRETV